MDQPHKVIIGNNHGDESGTLEIPEAVMDAAMDEYSKKHPHGFPIYLEDRTVIGHGNISADKKHIEIEMDGDFPLAELMKENLIGFSTVRLGDRADTIIEESKESKNA